MKTKCDECKGIGQYDCDSEPGPYGHTITVECADCNGEGWIEVEDDDESVTYVDKLCDRISTKFQKDAEAVFMTFTGQPERAYHITYFISRGDIQKESTVLLGGLTLTADCISHAISRFITTSGISESEIKYIIEL